MVRVNLTLDNFTDKMLKIIAMEKGISRSETVRKLVKEKIEKDNGALKKYGELVGKEDN
ncbi:hypothetical protein HGO21_12470 [Acinetobacter sp. CUI P1]|nr:hypothetical protein [Acinetobacter sp. CUI P1]